MVKKPVSQKLYTMHFFISMPNLIWNMTFFYSYTQTEKKQVLNIHISKFIIKWK